MTNRFDRAAEMLVGVRQGGQKLNDLPGDQIPQNQAEAYELQDAIIARKGVVGGWKVLAGGPAGDPMCSPLPNSIYFDNSAMIDSRGLLIFLTEVEVGLTLGKGFPQRATPYTQDEVRAGIASLHPALEMISSPFVDRKQVDKLALLGDLQSNGAVILGPALTDWTGFDTAALNIQLSYDGVEVATTDKGADLGQIVEALTWLANYAHTRGHELKAGDVIITGSRILLDAGDAKLISADVEGLGVVSVTLG